MPDDVFCIGFDILFVGIDDTAIGRVGLDSQPLVAPLQFVNTFIDKSKCTRDSQLSPRRHVP